MSGTTTELGLATAVDSDDNADYLTINLANSLRTVDGLFNNITGHNHGGAHQGGAITPAAGSITSGMIADGTIATADLANASVTNAKLASDTARANLLTNGGFEIWQRGNGPFTGPVGSARTADQWFFAGIGGDTYSLSKDTSNQDVGSAACAAVTFTKASGTTALVQTLSPDSTSLLGRVVSFSIRVRTATANAVRAGVYNGSVWTYSTYHTGGGAYQTLTVAGVTLGGSLAQVGVAFDVSCTAYLDNAMLVVGSQPADYAPLHPADDLARCLRYYERYDATANVYLAGGYAYSATGGVYLLPYSKKAVTPTATYSAASTFEVTNGTFGVVTCTAITTNSQIPGMLGIGTTVASGLTAGQGSVLAGNGTASIAFEANP